MQFITYPNGVAQTKADFLIQTLEALRDEALRLSTNSESADRARFHQDRARMLDSIVEDCYRRIMAEA